jgi:hypothetical protein
MLATHPAFRRRGWCRVLHACIQQWAAQHNIPRVTAEVAMEAVAMTVWRQFGFTKPNVGELHHPPLFQKTLFMCRDTDTTVRDLGYYDSGVAPLRRPSTRRRRLGSTGCLSVRPSVYRATPVCIVREVCQLSSAQLFHGLYQNATKVVPP